MIKVLLFDFGGVVLKHKPTMVKDILHEIFPDSLKPAEIWEKHRSGLNTGKSTDDDFIQELWNEIPTSYSVKQLKEKWLESYKKEATDIDWELLDFIGKLRSKYSVYLMTDTIQTHDAYNSGRSLYEKFDAVFKSFEEGVAKMNGKDAYLNVLSKIHVKPEEAVFVDDSEGNVKTSEQVGMRGVVYKNIEHLKGQLMKFGVKA